MDNTGYRTFAAVVVVGAYCFWIGYNIGRQKGSDEAAESMIRALDAAIYGRRVVDGERA